MFSICKVVGEDKTDEILRGVLTSDMDLYTLKAKRNHKYNDTKPV